MMGSFKEKLLEHCKAVVRRKIELIAFSMDEIRDSMENEAKSSAGDKHETARAKMQSEHEKLGWQLDEVKAQLIILDRIDLKQNADIISNGKLVQTDKGLFFISIPLGKVELEEKWVYVISSGSPLGKVFLGLAKGAVVKAGTSEYRILEIL